MEATARELANLLNGTVEGNETVKVNNITKIEEGQPGTLCFLANPKYAQYIYTTQAAIVLVNRNFVPEKPLQTTIIRVDDPYQAFLALLEYVKKQSVKRGISSLAFIAETAKIGAEVYIAPFVFIGENVVIEDNVILHAHVSIGDNSCVKKNTVLNSGVKIYHECIVGENCIIHAGTIIGADGFGFIAQKDGIPTKVPQTGNVIIENNVEIGANCTIDRATISSTIIREGVKLDNLVHIAHNCEIGKSSLLAGQVGIAGSAKIGKECVMGGQVAINDHVIMGNNVSVGGQAGVLSNVKDGETIFGSPAFDVRKAYKSFAIFRKLPEMYQQINDLKKEITELKKQLK